ncbi:MAG: N-acetyltransferase [bacterium]
MTISEVITKKELHQFIRFPYKLYRNDSNWVHPLIIEREEFFNPQKNPFYEHGEVKLFLALDSNNKPIGRISAHLNFNHNNFYKDKIGFFGFFECVENYDAAEQLFTAASLWLKSKGMEAMRGPMDFSTNEECGLLIKGFGEPPVLMMAYNPAYYIDFFERFGLVKAMDMIAYFFPYKEVPPYITKAAERILKRNNNIVIRVINRKRFWDEIEIFKKIYNSAWESNWGFVPLTDKEIVKMSKDFKMIMDNDLVMIAEVDGKPAGFSLILPDYNMVLKKMNGRLFPFGVFKLLLGKKKIDMVRVLTMGVIEEYRNLGIDILFYYYSFINAIKRGYSKAEFSWILEDNTMMNRILLRMGADPYKTYRIYDKKL